MALGKLDGVLDTNIGKVSALSSANIGKIGGGTFSTSYDSYTKLMLHMDGTNGSTSFPDSATSKTVTANGNAQVSTAQAEFGQSVYFDGTGDFLSTPNHTDFAFGSGDFTIDFWVRFSSLNSSPSNYPVFISKFDLSTGNDDSFFIRQDSTEKTLTFGYTTGGTFATYKSSSQAFDPSLNTWYHIAIVRSGANLLTFINGIKIGSAFNMGTDSIWTSARQLLIGSTTVAESISYCFNGYVDELRISKGIARWTTTFTPPSNPY